MELIALSEKHCGKQPPMLDLIEHNSVLIEFQTDFSQTAPGFSAFYRIFKPNGKRHLTLCECVNL